MASEAVKRCTRMRRKGKRNMVETEEKGNGESEDEE